MHVFLSIKKQPCFLVPLGWNVIRACAVTTVHSSSRPFLYALRRNMFRPEPMKTNGSARA